LRKVIETEKEDKIRWLVLLMVMGGVFLTTMDSGMVNIALPTIMRSFSIDLGKTNLVVIVYLLTITATLVFWGRISDRYGKGNIYLSGLLVFCFGSIICGFSTGFERLLLSRFVQAIGASMMMSSGPAIIKAVFPEEKLGQSLGLVGIATASGLMSGPMVSGILLTHFSWQAIFLVTVPVSAFIFIFAAFFLWHSLPPAERRREDTFDWQGSSCWAVLVIVFVLLLNRLPYSPGFIDIGGGTIVLMIIWLLVRVEQRAVNPIIPVSLITENYYIIALVTVAVSFAALFVVLILTPFFLKYVLHCSAAETGFVIMALPATLIVLSPLSGYIYDKIGGRILTTAGLCLCMAALSLLAFLSADSSLMAVAACLALLGAGQSVFLTPNSASVLSRVNHQNSGTTSGILATARNFGMVIGTTLATILFTFFLSYYGDGLKLEQYGGTALHQLSFLHALDSTFLLTAFGLFLAAILSSLRGE